MKATKQHFLVALFVTLYKVVLTFESVDEIQNVDEILISVTIQMKSIGQYFLVVL